jgi:hypothetical protein
MADDAAAVPPSRLGLLPSGMLRLTFFQCDFQRLADLFREIRGTKFYEVREAPSWKSEWTKFTPSWTRELVCRFNRDWCVHAHNGEVGGHLEHAIPARLPMQAVRFSALASGQWAPFFEMIAVDSRPGDLVTRVICVSNDDGPTRFDQRGAPLPFEDVKRYEARRPRFRCDVELLEQYAAALGLQLSITHDLGRCVVVDEKQPKG